MCCRERCLAPAAGQAGASWAGALGREWEREASQILKYQHRLAMPGTSSLQVKDGTKLIISFSTGLQIQTQQHQHFGLTAGWGSDPAAGAGERMEMKEE